MADGRKYFILSAAFLKQAELAIGDMTEVRFNIDDQEFVDIPVELDAALHGDERLAHLWDALTAGKKRFYAYQIASAKQAVTRQKRLLAVIKNLQEAALSS